MWHVVSKGLWTSASAVGALAAVGCSRHGPPSQASSVALHGKSNRPGVFREIAVEAGIHFGWGHGGRSPLDIQETIGHGCAFLDYDGDGQLDVLLVGETRCALYHNVGSLRFEDVTSRSGLDIEGKLCGVAIGDIDNDGHPDVFITGYGKCGLFRNRGGQSATIFQDITASSGVGATDPYDFVTAAAFADLDGDGKLDLIAGRYVKFTPDSVRFCKYGGVETTCGVLNYEPEATRVYRNSGNLSFADMTKAWGFDALHGRCLGIAIAASESGLGVTIYAANDELPGDLMILRGNRYVNVGATSGTAYGRDGMRQAGMGTDWGDYNNDGRPDLVVATFQGEPKSLYKNLGSCQFTEMSGTTGLSFETLAYIAWTAKFFDFDNDGWLDLFITNGHVQDNAPKVDRTRSYPQPLQLFRNEEARRFTNVAYEAGPAFQTPIVGRGASIGDFDNDGRLDLLIVNDEGPPLLLHNENVVENHWIGIRLVGKTCNRDGVGARVLVKAGNRTYVHDEQLAGGYISGQDPRLHFGLGTAQKVDSIEVRWPGGSRDVVKASDSRLGIDRYITVEQGRKQ